MVQRCKFSIELKNFPPDLSGEPYLPILSILKNTKNTQLYILGCKIGCLFCNLLIFSIYCGETGIRTPGTSQYNGFQDRRNRPLCHLSKTPFQKYFPLKALQRYNFILNKQIVYQFFCYKIFKSYFCIRIINERNKS